MKFTLQNQAQAHTILSCSPQRVVVRELGNGHEPRERVIERSAILASDRLVLDWPPQDVAALTVEHVRAALALEPEVLLLGTGERQQFPDARITHEVLKAGVGFEVMDTRAACRTYNVLLQEGRRAVVALLIGRNDGMNDRIE